jgi:hypothetical protein
MTRSQSDSISTILNCDPAAVAIRASKDHDTLNKLKEVVDQFKRYVGMIVQEDNKVLDSMGNEQGTDSLLTVARHLRENSKHVEASINRLENKSATLHRRRQNVTRSRPITSLSMRLDENSGRKGSTTTPRLPPRPRSLFVVEDPTASSTTVRERPLSPVLLVEDRIDSSIGANRVGMEVQSLNELSTATILSAQECLNVSIVSRRDDVEEGKQIATTSLVLIQRPRLHRLRVLNAGIKKKRRRRKTTMSKDSQRLRIRCLRISNAGLKKKRRRRKATRIMTPTTRIMSLAMRIPMRIGGGARL